MLTVVTEDGFPWLTGNSTEWQPAGEWNKRRSPSSELAGLSPDCGAGTFGLFLPTGRWKNHRGFGGQGRPEVA